MIDPKRVELTIFDGIPHLRASPVVVEVDKAVSVLQGIVREMDRRYLAFANTGVRNIDGYNRLPARTGREKMPYIILVIDELGYLPVDKQGAELLFQVISNRYECGSVVVTTNRAFRDWGAILNNDNTLASAMIDRLVHHGALVQIKGDSYRVK